jgi:hypothetical protein
LWWSQTESQQRTRRSDPPPFAVLDQAIAITTKVNTIAIDQVELIGRSDGLSTAGAQVAGYAGAVLEMPSVLQLAPGQEFGLGTGVVTVVLVDGGSLFVKVAPIFRAVCQI